MVRLAADENFNSDIVRGLVRRKADIDVVRVQDIGLSGADDATILEWAAQQGRVLVTHDVSTLTKHAFARVAAGQQMPGVFEVSTKVGVGPTIDDLLLIVECSLEGEWGAGAIPSAIGVCSNRGASISTTLNIYTHVVDASHREAVEAVERELFGEDRDPNGPKSPDRPNASKPVSAGIT